MSAILVTGGTGYVGGRLVRRLEEVGLDVRVATRRRDRAGAGRVVPLDWSDDAALAGACDGVETVIHLAAMNENECAADPAAALAVNGGNTVRLLDAAIAKGCRRFLYFSTAHVYGAPLVGAIDEAVAARPTHPYAITHRVAEDFVLAAHAQGRVEGLALRLSNAIGAPADPGADRWTVLVNDLCRQAAQTGRMRLRSSGLQQRDFVPLADVENAVLHLLRLERGALGDGLFNLGLGRSMSVLEMATLAAERAGVSLDRPDPAPGELSAPLSFSIAKLRQTGFTPMGDVTVAVDETIAFCRTHFGAEPS